MERLSCCECRDPAGCRHHRPQSQTQLDAYRAAAEHLLSLDLPPAPDVVAMRVMWRRGGASQRLAVLIAQRWELAG